MIQEAGNELIKLAAAGAVGGAFTLVAGGIALGKKLAQLAGIAQGLGEVKKELGEVRKFQREVIERLTRVETLLGTIANGGP